MYPTLGITSSVALVNVEGVTLVLGDLFVHSFIDERHGKKINRKLAKRTAKEACLYTWKSLTKAERRACTKYALDLLREAAK